MHSAQIKVIPMLTKELIDRGKFWSKAWSLVDGCTPVSPGCEHCWLKAMANQYKNCQGDFEGNVVFRDDRLDIPEEEKHPQVFAVWSDLHHESLNPYDIRAAYEIMAMHEHHTFLVITKRPENIRPVLYDGGTFAIYGDYGRGYLDNVWHFATAENQAQANKRMPELMKVPGHKGIMAEPLLSGIDFGPWLYQSDCKYKGIDGLCEALKFPLKCRTGTICPENQPFIEQVITGCETGAGARGCDPEWLYDLAAQCEVAGVPFYLKKVTPKKRSIGDRPEYNALAWENK